MHNNKYTLDRYGDILTPKDIHDILGIGYNKTYSLLKSGAIQNFKIGRDRKIPKHCLQKYIEDMTLQNSEQIHIQERDAQYDGNSKNKKQ